MKRIYMDNASTSQVSEDVIREMTDVLRFFGNPSSPGKEGREAKKILDKSRETIANCLCCEPSEIFFTSGGSESNNWAIKGIMNNRDNDGHIVISSMEHPSVYNTVTENNYKFTMLPAVGGVVKPVELIGLLNDKISLVSVIYASNETGAVQPVGELAGICHEKGVLFHTDAVQAAGHMSINIKKDGIDLLSISAHKFHGPKGVGALFIKNGTMPGKLINGGLQENGMRSGTENVPGICGMASALDIAVKNMESKNKKITLLKEYIIDKLLMIDGSVLNGHTNNQLPGIINISFRGVTGEQLVNILDLKGISVSTGAACMSGKANSRVLTAAGVYEETASGAVRISLSSGNTTEEAEKLISVLKDVVYLIRNNQ